MPEPLPEGMLPRRAWRNRRERGSPRAFRTAGRVLSSETRSTNDSRMALAEHGAPEGTRSLWRSRRRPAVAATAATGSRRLAPASTCRSSCRTPGESPPSDACRRRGRRGGHPPRHRPAGRHQVAERHRRRRPSTRRASAASWPASWPRASTGHGGVQYVVLGCGINVRPADYPPATRGASDVDRTRARAAGRCRAGALPKILVALNEQVDALARRKTARRS